MALIKRNQSVMHNLHGPDIEMIKCPSIKSTLCKDNLLSLEEALQDIGDEDIIGIEDVEEDFEPLVMTRRQGQIIVQDVDKDKKDKEEEKKSLGQNAGHQSQTQEQGWYSEEQPVAETDTSWESQKGNLLDKSGRENQYFAIPWCPLYRHCPFCDRSGACACDGDGPEKLAEGTRLGCL